MSDTLLSQRNVRVLAQGPGHCFFGYYDLQPYDTQQRRHLCHRVAFCDRLPQPGDEAQLGTVDVRTGCYTPFAQTAAWNFQQGAMLQWNPLCPGEEAVYNVREGSGFRCVTQNLATGARRVVDRAIASLAPDGRYGLGINFNRLYDFRPGYGYAGPDPWRDCAQPEDDGVFLVDMASGKSRLLVAYARIQREFAHDRADAKLVVNHITFSPASDRFLFLVRSFPTPGALWATMLLTCDLHGNLHRVLGYGMISHYHWKNDRQILAYAEVEGVRGVYLIDDQKNAFTRLDAPCFQDDLHCLYSPSRRYILGDAYPDAQGYRTIYLYDTVTGACATVAKAYSPPVACVDIRCDLHARWSPQGNRVSFDSMHDGSRVICEADMSDLPDA